MTDPTVTTAPTPKRRWGRRVATALLLLVFVTATATSAIVGHQIWVTSNVYRDGAEYYRNLTHFIDIGPQSMQAEFPISVDFDILQGQYPEIVGWLYSPDTPINYPVMGGTDYSYYLSHLPNGSENLLGSLFTDYNHHSDFTDQLNIIYGHHSANDAMLASLMGYKNPDYYTAHPRMYLATPTNNYIVDVTYGAVIPAGGWRERAFMYTQNLDRLLAYMQHHTTFDTTQVPENTLETQYLLLSTCTYEYDDARYLLLGTLTPSP